MARNQVVTVVGKRVSCPHCSCEVFETRDHYIAGAVLQGFDLEAFGKQGMILICNHCSHVQHFAKAKALTLQTARK